MRRLLMLIVVGVFVAACGGSASDVAADPDANPPEGDTPAAPASSEDAASADSSPAQAPFGVVETVDGGTLDGEDYAGRSLALWFWAPW